jgi:hypothetical protein
VRANIDDIRAPRAVASGAERDQARVQVTLREAHVHVFRYYRAWLARTRGGEELAEALAVEALVRIARLPSSPEDFSEAEVIAAWLSVARDVAREAVTG